MKGFRTIVSLLDENQQKPVYDIKKAKGLGFVRNSIPIRDFNAPTQEQFLEFLEVMNKSKGKVIIHCEGGFGRTGTMGAAYWIFKGMPAHKAIHKVRQANPAAVSVSEQENSLYELAAFIAQEG